ncbi:MAG: hypothetical protein HZB13_17600 [Acidobacteria bacterium]|nr:hypothetical protein [Acidobacteriota bacterium]
MRQKLSGVLLIWTLPMWGAVTSVRLVERTDVLEGRALGPAGAYERIVAKVHFALDPKTEQNGAIRDIQLAPKNGQGLVEFTADLYVLKPRDPAKGNGTLLFEVSNRGGKGMLSRFQYAKSALDPRTEEEFGDLWLMEQGYTLVWCGWQWDVPEKDKLMRLDGPVLEGVKGVVRAEYIPDKATNVMALSDRGHVTYSALEGPAKLTVRATVRGRRRTIAASQWSFNAERTAIEVKGGLEPGQIYELVYQAANPRVAGLGLAAVRDVVSFFKYTRNGETLLGDQPRYIKRALGFGISQSGRFLRTFLYYGFNDDEKGKKVFDGVWADVAGAGRGSFNHRFAQASRDGYAHMNTLYPTDLYPFSDVPQVDPGTQENEGLLNRVAAAVMPKVFYTNGSWEYWNRCAALVHTSLNGTMDVPLGPETRLYVYSGSQHGPGNMPGKSKGAQFALNPNDHRPLQRALLSALHDWVKEGKAPPASRFPLLVEEELTRPENVKWPKSMATRLPAHPKQAYGLDYGEDFAEKGVVTKEPPEVKWGYPVLVPQVDADGNELGGIRMPEVAAPLGTFTGWNLRSADAGAIGEMAPTLGSFFAFGKDELARRYKDKDGYLGKVAEEADKLVKGRLLLDRDKGRVLKHAAALWEFVNK